MRNSTKALLGAVLSDGKIYPQVKSWIMEDEAFESGMPRFIWQSMGELYEEREDIDIMSVATQMEKHGVTHAITHLSDIQLAVTSSLNFEFHAKDVREHYLRLKLRNMGLSLSTTAETEEDVFNLITKQKKLINEIEDLSPTSVMNIAQVEDLAIRHLEAGDEILKTGFFTYDQMAGGITIGETSVLGGRPGHGKSIFGKELAKHSSLKKIRTLVISYEMSASQWYMRLLPEMTGIEARRFRHEYQTIITDESELIGQGVGQIRELFKDNLFIIERPKSITNAIADIRRLQPQLVIVDHFHKIPTPKSMAQWSDRERINRFLDEYANGAKDENFHLCAISQLNRDIENRIIKVPTMSDLKGSGNFEEYAESIFLLYREYNYNNESGGEYETAVIMPKCRFDKASDTTIGFNPNNLCLYPTPEQAMAGGMTFERTIQ